MAGQWQVVAGQRQGRVGQAQSSPPLRITTTRKPPRTRPSPPGRHPAGTQQTMSPHLLTTSKPEPKPNGTHIMEPWYKMRGVEAHIKGALSSECVCGWWGG